MAGAAAAASEASLSRSLVLVDRTLGMNIGDLTGNGGLAAAWDGNTNQAAAACASKASATAGWIGKTLAASTTLGQVMIYGSNDAGFSSAGNPNALNFNIRGKNGAAPASSTDGTLLATSGALTDTANESAGRGPYVSSDIYIKWDHLIVEITYGLANDFKVAEVQFYEWK